MIAAAVTDLGYLLLGLADSPAAHALAGRWSRRRYARLAPGYEAYVARHPAYGDALEDALSAVDARPRRILDAGAGTGFAASILTRRFPSAHVVACDLSVPMLAHARRRVPGVPVVCADAGRLPFRTGVFDLVVVHNAPPHPGELARVLSNGGWLVAAFSAAGTLPRFLHAAVVRRLRRRGLDLVRQRRVGSGWSVIARRAGGS